ncbi:MAG: hypothetical protein Kow0026_12560 [Oricola sp.]
MISKLRGAIPPIAAGLLMISGISALADDAANNKATPENGPVLDRLVPFSSVIASPRNLASNIIGSPVYSMDGKRIGTINDIIFDNDGKTIAFEIGTGGILGLDETRVALPSDQVRFEMRDGSLRIAADIVEQDIRDIAGD